MIDSDGSQQSGEIVLCFGPEVESSRYVYTCLDVAIINKTGLSDRTIRTPPMHKPNATHQ